MKFVELYRKSGGWGTRGFVALSAADKKMPRFISRGSATPVDDYKESRMKFIDPKKLHRKSGGMGHPTIRGQDIVLRGRFPHGYPGSCVPAGVCYFCPSFCAAIWPAADFELLSWA